MAKLTVSFLVLFFLATLAYAQEKKSVASVMIGDNAPSFTANTTAGQLSFPSDFGSSWKILFSHPRDFTPVCSSEILQLAYMQDELKKLGIQIAVISTDTYDRHVMWKDAMEEIVSQNNQSVTIDFPLIDDSGFQVAMKYGMLHNKASSTEYVRGVFIINPENKVCATYYYPMAVGRNMNEIIRAVKAMQVAENSAYMTPANWTPGDDLLVPHFPYTDRELELNPSIADQFYLVGSLMWFKKNTELVNE